jgi:cytoskeletal protein CcmA (bactofilin family)
MASVSRISYLPPGLSVTGDIVAQEDLCIGGRVDGTVTMPDHHLEVREGAVVHAKLVAASAAIAGTVEGTVVAAGRVRIDATASVRGHLVTPGVTLRDGAQFTGTVDPERSEAAVHVAKYRQNHPDAAKIV